MKTHPHAHEHTHPYHHSASVINKRVGGISEATKLAVAEIAARQLTVPFVMQAARQLVIASA